MPLLRRAHAHHRDLRGRLTCSTQCRRRTTLVLGRRCQRLLRCGRSTPVRHSNFPSERELRASNGSDALSRHRSSMQQAQPIAPHHHRLRGQIAIERAAPSVPRLPRLRALQVCRRRPTLAVAPSLTAGIRKPLQGEIESAGSAQATASCTRGLWTGHDRRPASVGTDLVRQPFDRLDQRAHRRSDRGRRAIEDARRAGHGQSGHQERRDAAHLATQHL